MSGWEEIWLYLHPQALYEDPDYPRIEVFGVAAPEEGEDWVPARASDIRREMDEQRRLLELGLHVDGELCPWHGLLHLEDGAFRWEAEAEEYLLVD